jgi:hypothetical protein
VVEGGGDAFSGAVWGVVPALERVGVEGVGEVDAGPSDFADGGVFIVGRGDALDGGDEGAE